MCMWVRWSWTARAAAAIVTAHRKRRRLDTRRGRRRRRRRSDAEAEAAAAAAAAAAAGRWSVSSSWRQRQVLQRARSQRNGTRTHRREGDESNKQAAALARRRQAKAKTKGKGSRGGRAGGADRLVCLSVCLLCSALRCSVRVCGRVDRCSSLAASVSRQVRGGGRGWGVAARWEGEAVRRNPKGGAAARSKQTNSQNQPSETKRAHVTSFLSLLANILFIRFDSV